MNIILIILTVIFTGIRGIMSRELSGVTFGTKSFFKAQTILFLSGCCILLIINPVSVYNISHTTFLLSLIYAVFLTSAQWSYTFSLSKGNIGICSTIYSMGFIFPAISGYLFWDESLTVSGVTGILIAIIAIITSGKKSDTIQNVTTKNIFIIPLLLAMFSSGCLGILQKHHQSTAFSHQTSGFIITAFAFASVFSAISMFVAKNSKPSLVVKKTFYASLTGIAFAASNVINTYLSGRFDSAVIFPILNIGTIIFAYMSGILLYKEKISKKDLAVLIMAVTSIFLISSK